MPTSATVPFSNDLWNTYSVYVAGCYGNVMENCCNVMRLHEQEH